MKELNVPKLKSYCSNIYTVNSGINGYQTMPLEKSGIDLPPYPYGLYGAKPKDVQGRTKTKADCKSGKYINIHIRRCQLDYFVLQIEWHI